MCNRGQKRKILLSALLKSGHASIEHPVEQRFFVRKVVEKPTLAYARLCSNSIQCEMARFLEGTLTKTVQEPINRVRIQADGGSGVPVGAGPVTSESSSQ